MTDTFYTLGIPVNFVVEGTPRPQGSKSFVRGRIVEASKYVGPWRKTVAKEAAEVFPHPTVDPVKVTLTFVFERPKSHMYADGRLKPHCHESHIQRPDVDKLSRAILDALTGIAYVDDSQVVSLDAIKVWGPKAGVKISVTLVA